MRRFLLLGQTGVGKSSFVNATFGVRLAPTSDFEACTKTVEYYTRHNSFGDVCLIDTPGLAEDTLERDEAYLSLIKNRIDWESIYASVYISRLDENRLRPDEQRTLSRLTKQLGNRVWERAWLVLTFAASVPNARRGEVVSTRIEQIEGCLRQLTTTNGAPTFAEFRMRIMVDNVVTNWSENAKPIMSFLADTAA